MPIPTKIKNQIKQNPFYEKCCLTGDAREVIQWHHCYMYAGQQIQETWNIIPVKFSLHSPYGISQSIHREGFKNKQRARKIALERAIELYGSLEYLQDKYPKKDWHKEYKYLNSIKL